MGIIADLRRWTVDRFKEDEYVDGSPKEKLRALAEKLPHLTPEERQRQLQHARGYSDYYYLGHQKENVPVEVQQSFRELDRSVEKMNRVDLAREVLQKYGGPPTSATLEDALDRSYKQRDQLLQKGFQQTVEKSPKQKLKEFVKEHTAEI